MPRPRPRRRRLQLPGGLFDRVDLKLTQPSLVPSEAVPAILSYLQGRGLAGNEGVMRPGKNGGFLGWGVELDLPAALRLSGAKAYFIYYAPKRVREHAATFHLLVIENGQRLWRADLAEHGSCAPVPATLPEWESNVLPTEFIRDLYTDGGYYEGRLSQIALINRRARRLLDWYNGVVTNAINSSRRASRRHLVPRDVVDRVTHVRASRVEVAHDIPEDDLPGGPQPYLRAAAQVIPDMKDYDEPGAIGKRGQITRSLQYAIYAKPTAKILRMETKYVGRKIPWDVHDDFETADVLQRLMDADRKPGRGGPFWPRVVATAQSPRPRIGTLNLKPLLARFHRKTHDRVRHVLDEVSSTRGGYIPANTPEASTALRLRDLGVLRRGGRDGRRVIWTINYPGLFKLLRLQRSGAVL